MSPRKCLSASVVEFAFLLSQGYPPMNLVAWSWTTNAAVSLLLFVLASLRILWSAEMSSANSVGTLRLVSGEVWSAFGFFRWYLRTGLLSSQILHPLHFGKCVKMLCSAVGLTMVLCLLLRRLASRSSLVSSNSTVEGGGGGTESVSSGGASAVISGFGAEGSMGVGGGIASAGGC